MIVLDTHIWVKWIIDGNPALSETIVNAMRVDRHWTAAWRLGSRILGKRCYTVFQMKSFSCIPVL
jgi:hypothetical protein